MPENSRELPDSTYARRMGAGPLLCEIILEDNEVAYVDADDLRDYYHSFRVSKERALSNALLSCCFGLVGLNILADL